MAIRHGLPGQYGKKEATQRSRTMVLTLFAVIFYVVAVLAFLTGLTWSRRGPGLALVTMAAATAAFAVMWRIATRYFDRVAKERIKYLRGGQTEALVSYLLEQNLEDDWHVFNCVKLQRDCDIDHVVVGPGGIFCISTKSHRGHFAGTPDGLLHNGQPCPFAQQAIGQTMDLTKRLGAIMGADVPWVQSVLALPFGYTEKDAYGGTVWLAHQENITDRIAPENGPRKLDKQQIERVVKVMEMIRTGAADVYERPAIAAQTS